MASAVAPQPQSANNRTIVVWTAPRCISTAFERAIIERGDCRVLHEPFSRAYYYGPEARSSRYAAEERSADTFDSVKRELYSSQLAGEAKPVFSSEGNGPVFAKDSEVPTTHRPDTRSLNARAVQWRTTCMVWKTKVWCKSRRGSNTRS